MKAPSAVIPLALFLSDVLVEGQPSDDGEQRGSRVRRLDGIAARNRDNLKRDHYRDHGIVLTDGAIDEAIRDARVSAGEGWSENDRPVLMSRVRGLEDYYDEQQRQDRNLIFWDGSRAKDGNNDNTYQDVDETNVVDQQDLEDAGFAMNARTSIVDFEEGVLVSGLSPGWSWNEGRNEYWCVAIPELAQTTVPKQGTPMKLENCETTSRAAMVLDYTTEYELVMSQIYDINAEWCLDSTKLKKKGRIEVNWCDVYEENQQFQIIEDDNTWRMYADTSLCAQSIYIPPDPTPAPTPAPPAPTPAPTTRPWWAGPDWTPPEQNATLPPVPVAPLPEVSNKTMIPEFEIRLNDCATEFGGPARHVRGRRLGGDDSEDRKGQVFIYCYESTVCGSSGNGQIGCKQISSCAV